MAQAQSALGVTMQVPGAPAERSQHEPRPQSSAELQPEAQKPLMQVRPSPRPPERKLETHWESVSQPQPPPRQ